MIITGYLLILYSDVLPFLSEIVFYIIIVVDVIMKVVLLVFVGLAVKNTLISQKSFGLKHKKKLMEEYEFSKLLFCKS